MNIILYLIQLVQSLYQMNFWLWAFICKNVPLKQWVYDDSKSPKYQKFKTDELPRFQYIHSDWDYKSLIECFKKHYGKTIQPVRRRGECDIPDDARCPACNAPKIYLYRNNGKGGQLMCSVCSTRFAPDQNRFSKQFMLRCPHCDHALVPVKNRKHFIIHKCINKKCPYYLHNLKNVSKEHLDEPHGKWRYKLHYIYREFVIDFFKMDLDSLPNNTASFRFSKHNAHVMSLCLTLHVNLGLSLRKTSQAMNDLYGIRISHQQVANYARLAAIVIKPFVDHYDYQPSASFAADETYTKIRKKKSYVWLIIDTVSRSILGYQVSDNRGVGPCILAMRMAFRHFKNKLPEGFRFIADGYSAYPLAAQQFFLKHGESMKFDITQVIGLTNEDAVSKEFRPYKQMIERLNRTFKASYRVKCGYDNLESENYSVALWVAYYNFLRPHQSFGYKVLNPIPALEEAGNMPGKWQLLMYFGQQTILKLQQQKVCS